MTKYILIFLFLFPLNAFSNDVVAILNLKFIKDTDQTATTLCYDNEGENCHRWASFYLYEAKVKQVLSGELVTKKFKVIYGRHALKKKNLKRVVASLKKLEESANADYQIIEMGNELKMYCLSGEYNMPYNVNDISEGKQLTCFQDEH